MVHDMLMEVILPYANFVLFLIALVYFARKPARVAADKRKTDYERVLREATAAKEAAQAQLQKLQERHARLDQEIAEIKAMSKQSAEQEAARIVQESERLATHLREEAKRIANAEVENARLALRRDIVSAVRDAVSGKIRTELSADRHVSLVKQRVGELKTIKAEG